MIKLSEFITIHVWVTCLKNAIMFFFVFRESLHPHHLSVIQILVTPQTIAKQLSLEQPLTNTQKVDSDTLFLIVVAIREV